MSHKEAVAQVRQSVSQAQELTKPLLRGYSHAVMAPVALVLTVYLAWVSAGDLSRQLSLLVYGCALVLLFSVSATYHIGNWPQRVRELLRRFDHSNIFLVIAATYTPICVVLLDGWWRIGILAVVWVLALTGIIVTVSGVPMRRGLMTALYVMVGWVAIAAVPKILTSVGLTGGGFILAAGILYSLGAVCYAFKWPPLWRRVFSYHEVFHLFVIGASVLFFFFMLGYVIPLPRV
jgi:hemolysin III